MAVNRELSRLLRAAEQGLPSYHLRNPWFSRRKLAAFAYVAEQYGYRYGGLSSPPTAAAPTVAFHRLPDARDRVVRSLERYPDAHRGGQLPGMRPGRRRLSPLPETRREVDLVFARFLLDVTEEPYVRKRTRHVFFTVTACMLFVAVVAAFHANSVSTYASAVLVIDGGLALLVLAAYFLGRFTVPRSRERADRLLASAGR